MSDARPATAPVQFVAGFSTRGHTGERLAQAFAPAGFAPSDLRARAAAPRGVDRLASLALMAGALQRLERVGPEVVAGVARACLPAAWQARPGPLGTLPPGWSPGPSS